MKIALIYPSVDECGFNKTKSPMLFNQIHEGLSILSAVCKKEGFGDLHLVDLRLLSGWEEFKDRIKEIAPEVTGITMMSPDYNPATKCIDIIKDVDDSIKVVVGGMHPTVMTEEVAANPKIDYIVVSEGEKVFPELLRKIEKKTASPRIVKGERLEVDTLPFIDRELFDFLELPYDFFLPLPFATILAGRGCGYHCRFCSPAGKLMHGTKIRRRSVDNVIREVRHLRDTYGIKSLQFWDDCFTEDKDWVIDFCAAYRNEGFKMPFVCQTRADIICKYPEMMKRLKRAGLKMASIGFESGNERILKFINKGSTLSENLNAAKVCKKLGIKIWAYNMYGLPTETPDEAWDTVKMIRKIKPYRSSAAFFTPHPGSSFYEYCKKNNLSLIGPHDNFVRFPEIDRPKIKGIDYELMRKMTVISKRPSMGVKIRVRIERGSAHKKSKSFKRKFTEELEKMPGTNKMTVLRLAHRAGRM